MYATSNAILSHRICPTSNPSTPKSYHSLCSTASSTHFGTPSWLNSPLLKASRDSFHLLTHRHHLQSFFKIGLRSLPLEAEKVRNSSLTWAARVWEPWSWAFVLQYPSRKNPVRGELEQISRGWLKTFKEEDRDIVEEEWLAVLTPALEVDPKLLISLVRIEILGSSWC